MNLDQQKTVQQHFENMFRENKTPWRHTEVEPLFDEFFQILVDKKPNAKILDIGCGDGWATIYAAKRGFEAWGMDSSSTAITKAAGKAKVQNVTNLAHFGVGDVFNLKYSSGFFDAIIDGGLFHHIIPENRVLYFENVVRVLKEDSYFYLSAFSKSTPTKIGYHFTPKEIEKLFSQWFSVIKYSADEEIPDAPFLTLHYILRHG
ncbi:MAG TPA: class I SAM-dependent methyltransferase [Candidatus Saccharimonadales bacterium]|nr:class I SAM-dependent methyltransferase [Candidatus Saccharimonadales bacterium]